MSESSTPSYWKKCSSCKAPIAFSQKYWVCSVSTCNRQRTGLAFCKVSCFDAHVPMMNHKDAGAFEKRAPSIAEWQKEQVASASFNTQEPSAKATSKTEPSGAVQREILVVVSKTKDYIRAKHGINTSDRVMEVLSDRLRGILDEASKRALEDNRKTLMDRDF